MVKVSKIEQNPRKPHNFEINPLYSTCVCYNRMFSLCVHVLEI